MYVTHWKDSPIVDLGTHCDTVAGLLKRGICWGCEHRLYNAYSTALHFNAFRTILPSPYQVSVWPQVQLNIRTVDFDSESYQPSQQDDNDAAAAVEGKAATNEGATDEDPTGEVAADEGDDVASQDVVEVLNQLEPFRPPPGSAQEESNVRVDPTRRGAYDVSQEVTRGGKSAYMARRNSRLPSTDRDVLSQSSLMLRNIPES